MRRAFFAVPFALIAMLGTLKPATAQTVDDSIPALTSRAQKGDAVAQFNLGVKYDLGQSVPQNHAEAVKWYRLAADQGHASAQYNLGVSYDDGRGVPQNHAEALKWYRLAADQGQAAAQASMDEHPDSVNDGAFAVIMPTTVRGVTSGMIVDYPASYHNGAAGFSFADGHSEIHKWIGSAIKPPVKNDSGWLSRIDAGDSAKDIEWLSSVTTVPK